MADALGRMTAHFSLVNLDKKKDEMTVTGIRGCQLRPDAHNLMEVESGKKLLNEEPEIEAKRNSSDFVSVTLNNRSVFFKAHSFFYELGEQEKISDFDKFIPAEKTYAVFFDLDNTLKGAFFVRRDGGVNGVELRGGDHGEQLEKLNTIHNSELCKGFYIVTAGATTAYALLNITWKQSLVNLGVRHMFEPESFQSSPQSKQCDQLQVRVIQSNNEACGGNSYSTMFRIGNAIGSRDKAFAIKSAIQEDFSEGQLPEYVIFIDDCYDNAVDVFLAFAKKDVSEPVNVISIYYQSGRQDETSLYKKTFDPIRKELKKVKRRQVDNTNVS